MRIALQDVHGTNGIGTEEAESHETKGEQEQVVAVLVGMLSCNAEDYGTGESASCWESEVQELVFWDSLASFLCHPVGSDVGLGENVSKSLRYLPRIASAL